MNSETNEVGMKLQKLREYHSINLRDLAQAIGVRHVMLNKIENGTQRLDLETLIKLANHFSISAEYFVNPHVSILQATQNVSEPSSCVTAFKQILEKYSTEKEQAFKNNSLADFIRNDLIKIVNNALNIDSSRYKVIGSPGKGVWARVPWIGFFDRNVTLSAQYGYYVVCLFREDMSGFYLSLNQGYTYFRNRYKDKEGRQKIKKTAEIIRSRIEIPSQFHLTTIDLRSEASLAFGYEAGHICGKYYDANSLPDEFEMINDFRSLLEIYNKIVVLLNGRNAEELNDYLLLEDDLEFLETDEESFQKLANELKVDSFDKSKEEPRPPKTVVTDNLGKTRYPRSAKEAALALVRANYLCELDENHETFLSKSTGQRYAEAHHFVGISNHPKFPEVDLDRAANIVCLCPNCHRKIHYGEDDVRLPMIESLFAKVKERLEQVGIEVTLTQLKEFYNISPKRT
ncbi:MAG: MrcB family domain-containing protein [Exiguobacterium acetylicum]